LLIRELPASAARSARGHSSTRLRASSIARLARFKARDANLARYTRSGLFESKRHVVPQVGAALSARLPAATAGTASAEHVVDTEKIAKDVLKFLEYR
jgi:hypothetical protein